jgi:copper chaperone CopZ
VALTIESGARVIENVDMPVAAETVGQVDVTSDPSAAKVTVDGKVAGQTPLKLRDVDAGRHTIVVSHGAATVTRIVEAVAGGTSSVFVSLAASAPATTGTFAVEAPVELRVLENGQLLGVSNAAPLVMSVGRHQVDLSNDALDLHLTRAIAIDPGKATQISVSVPNGVLFINATPWADVFVDGRNVGVTPLGNVAVAVGNHDVMFRHPQFGERHRTVVVGARTPARVAVDLTR